MIGVWRFTLTTVILGVRSCFAACDYCENKPRNPKKYPDTQHQPVTDFKFIQEEHYVENTKLVGGPMLKIYLKVLVHCTSLTGYGFTRKASRLLH